MAKPQTQILIRLEDEPELKAKFDVIKARLGIKSNTEVIRYLINNRYEGLAAHPISS